MLRRILNAIVSVIKEQTVVSAKPLSLRNRAERRAKHRLS